MNFTAISISHSLSSPVIQCDQWIKQCSTPNVSSHPFTPFTLCNSYCSVCFCKCDNGVFLFVFFFYYCNDASFWCNEMYAFACWPNGTFMWSSGGSNMWARFAFPFLIHMYKVPKRCFWQQKIMFSLHSIPELETYVSILSSWSFSCLQRNSTFKRHTLQFSPFFVVSLLNILNVSLATCG